MVPHDQRTTGRKRNVFIEARRFVRANLSAFVATGLEWCLVTAMVAAGIGYLMAAAAGAIAGAAMDFSLKRHWAFMRTSKDAAHAEAVRYVLASAASLVLNLAVAYVCVSIAGLPAVAGVIAASAIVGVLWNYPVHRYVVFAAGTAVAGTTDQPCRPEPAA
jgi:putative flippase GtrA